jgi:hypothetical protein
MDKHIDVEYQYDKIVLDLSKMKLRASPLPHAAWEAMQNAGRRLYNHAYGCDSYTDVMTNDGDSTLNELWDVASQAVDNTLDERSQNAQLAEVAYRVEAAYAVLNFGVEILLK